MKRSLIRSHSLDYSTLEKRQMLSADLDAARNQVVDGDFENESSTAFIAFADGDDTNVQEIRFRDVNTSFSRIVELDSQAGQIDSLAQDVTLQSTGDLVISFDLRGRTLQPGDTADTNDVEVLFGDESLGVFTGLDRWQTITIAVNADELENRLEFREASESSDGKGILLDHVSIAHVREMNVVNGSFEELNSEIPVTASEVPGFFAVPNIEIVPIGVEAVDDAADGNHVLAIDTSDFRLDRVFQNFATENGASYFVSFSLRNVDTDNLDTTLRAKWNNEFAGSFKADANWQTFGTVVNADSDFSTLLFRESNPEDGSGLQIDDVRIFKIGSLASDYVLDLNGANDGTLVVRNIVENIESDITPHDLSVQFNNGNMLQSATVRIQEFEGSEYLMANVDGTNIDANFNDQTGILRLVGRDSVENYQSVLRTLRYDDSSDTPPPSKRIVVSVTDGTIGSERAPIWLNITAVNDLPVVTQPDPITAVVGEQVSIPIQAFDPEMQDLDFAFSNFSGDLEILGFDFDGGPGFENPQITPEGNLEFMTYAYGTTNIDIAVTDPDSNEPVIASFEVNVPFMDSVNDVPDDFEPFSGQRQLSWVTPFERNGIYDSAPEMSIDTSMDYRAVIETADGLIRIDLFESESPITVNNFINLAEDGFYDGLTFHRVINSPPVAQGGDPTGLGFGGPGYEFVDELNNGLEFEQFGQLAMANAGPNTNGSQFFFTLNDNPAFAGEHTIFGQVIDGNDVLQAVNQTSSGTPEVIQRVTIEIV